MRRFIAAAGVALTIFGCSHNAENELVGKWTADRYGNIYLLSVVQNGDTYLVTRQDGFDPSKKKVSPATIASNVLIINQFEKFSINKSNGLLVGDINIADGYKKISDTEFETQLKTLTLKK
jgi:hypothetical protein